MTQIIKKIVNQRKVYCDGSTNVNVLGHPKIYLEIKSDTDEIVCPYCSKKFIYIKDVFEE